MPGRKYQAGSGSYRFSMNGQEKDKELNEDITTAMYWEYDSRIGRRWNLDPKPSSAVSSYSCFKNNPIWNFDKEGDSIILGDDPHIQVRTAYDMLKKIKSGVELLNKYVSSSNENIYLGVISVKGKAIMQTLANIDTKKYIDKNNNLDEDKFKDDHTSSTNVEQILHWFANNQKFIKDGSLTHLVGLNIEGNRNVGTLDKYDLAFVLYHEIAAHIKGATGDANLDHNKFGNTVYTPGLILRSNTIVGGLTVQPNTEAWTVFEELLALKIQNKDATKQNISDYQFMIDTDNNAKKTKRKK